MTIFKKRISSLIQAKIYEIYDSYVPSICHAGKICGAGGGGYFLFFTKDEFKSHLNKYLKIEIDNFGTTIIYNNY